MLLYTSNIAINILQIPSIFIEHVNLLVRLPFRYVVYTVRMILILVSLID